MKVRITMEFTPSEVQAITGDVEAEKRRPSIVDFMYAAVAEALPAKMKQYRKLQIGELQDRIAELESED